MIRVIYSYVKSAVLFSVMLAAVAAGVTLTCLFTHTTHDFVIRIIALAVLLVASYAASFAYVLKLVAAEIGRDGYIDCNTEKLGEHLLKLAHRAVFGGVRASLLLELANMRIAEGRYEDAMLHASDAIVYGGEGAKDDAAVCFCKIYFMLGDGEYFAKYYERAAASLQKACMSKNPTEILSAGVSLAEIDAMKLSLGGDTPAALARIDGAPQNMYPLQKKTVSAFREKIAAQAK